MTAKLGFLGGGLVIVEGFVGKALKSVIKMDS